MAKLLPEWFTPTGSGGGLFGGALEQYESSPLGQRQYDAFEAYAAQARKEADFDMDIRKRELDLRVQQLAQQGRVAEAAAENQRGQLELARKRFAFEKEIETKRFNLSRAETLANFSSGPDMLFMRNDLMGALQRAGLGAGPAPYGSGGGPQMRTTADFEAAEAGTWNGANSGPVVGGTSAYPTLVQTPEGGTAAASAQGQARPNATGTTMGAEGSGPDPRIKAARAVMEAIPPSETAGGDENDMAALNAVVNIYKAGRPGTLQRMRPGQRQAFAAGLSRAGLWAPDAIEDMLRSGVGQGNVRMAA